MSDRLTAKQKEVLAAMRERNAVEPDGTVVMSTETFLTDRYNLWIHWRTAEALERRGLVKIVDDDRLPEEGAEVVLTEAGMML